MFPIIILEKTESLFHQTSKKIRQQKPDSKVVIMICFLILCTYFIKIVGIFQQNNLKTQFSDFQLSGTEKYIWRDTKKVTADTQRKNEREEIESEENMRAFVSG